MVQRPFREGRNAMNDDYLIARWLSRKNSVLVLIAVFLSLSIWIASYPYRVMTMDIADATTNYIWVQQYAHGIFAIPYSQWTYGITQSVVVLHNGQYLVLNEKGPGFALIIVPFFLLHITWLFAPVMVAMAVASTYMLSLRLLNWKVAFFAALITLLNLSVLIMWAHYYWTDAATMHLLVFSVWLLVEANYRQGGKTLSVSSEKKASPRDPVLSVVLSLLSGLAFGAAVSTRYPVALLLPALFIYIVVFCLMRSRPHLRNKNYRKALRSWKGMVLILFFIVGLAAVLVPLMHYNSTYFGGPFNSGYDATTLLSFSHNQQISPRNQSQNWFNSVFSDAGYAARNFVDLLPILVFRMPALLLLPPGLWLIRKNRPALALLAPWILIAFYTYLSISWVVKYDSLRTYIQTVWEPRYFMPAIPPLAVLAGVALERLTESGKTRETPGDLKEKESAGGCARGASRQRVYPSAIFMAVVTALGIIPMILFFSHNGGIIVAPHALPHNRGLPVKGAAEYLINLLYSTFT